MHSTAGDGKIGFTSSESDRSVFGQNRAKARTPTSVPMSLWNRVYESLPVSGFSSGVLGELAALDVSSGESKRVGWRESISASLPL